MRAAQTSSSKCDDDAKQDEGQNICSCVNKKYLYSKLFYFFYFAGSGTIVPYLPLFFKQLGLTTNQVGVITGVQPFVSFVFTPTWGAIVDKGKRGKFILVVAFVSLILSAIATVIVTSKHSACPSDSRLFNTSNNTYPASKLVKTVEVDHNDIRDKEPVLMVQYHSLWSFSGKVQETSLSRETGNVDPHVNSLFIALLIITIVGTIFGCPSLALGDAATVIQLKQNNEWHKYGSQKLWASIGWGVAALSVGALVSKIPLCPHVNSNSVAGPNVNYFPCFYAYMILKLLALMSGLRIDFSNNVEKDVEDKKTKCVQAALPLIFSLKYITFLLITLYSGIMLSLVIGFVFWHLEDLGGNQVLFSVLPAIRCVGDTFVYFISPRLISAIGYLNLMYLGLLAYAVRFTCYAFVRNPLVVIPFEFMSGLSTAGLWAGMVAFVANNSVDGAANTLQGQ